MSVDAALVVLGRGKLERWLFDSERDWRAACDAEEAFLRAVESCLEEKTGRVTTLVGTVIDGTSPTRGDPSEKEVAIEIVGGTDGLAPIQDLALSATLTGRPIARRHDDAHEPMRRARELGFERPLGEFRHLLDHDPLMGYYLPYDFPIPLWVYDDRESRDIPVGSATRLLVELDRWFDLAQSLPANEGWLVHHAQGLANIAQGSVKTGLAVELM